MQLTGEIYGIKSKSPLYLLSDKEGTYHRDSQLLFYLLLSHSVFHIGLYLRAILQHSTSHYANILIVCRADDDTRQRSSLQQVKIVDNEFYRFSIHGIQT